MPSRSFLSLLIFPSFFPISYLLTVIKILAPTCIHSHTDTLAYIIKKKEMYMKKILLIGAFISSIFTSCSDFLEKNPSTSLPVEEAITSLDDFGNAVNGIYYLMSEDPT